MKKVFILLFVLLTSSFHLFASGYYDSGFRLGFKGGIGISNLTRMNAIRVHGLPDADYSVGKGFDISPHWAYELGLFSIEYNANNDMYYQLNIGHAGGGVKLKDVKKQYDTNISGIFISTAHLKTFVGKKHDVNINHNSRMFFGAGPYIALAFSAYEGSGDVLYEEFYDPDTEEYYEVSTVIGDEPEVRAFQFGMSAHFGLEFNKIQTGIEIDYGLTRIFKDLRYKSHSIAAKLFVTFYL